jgi:CO/xanthine dehydrogenase FAD-binding subunit
VEAEEAIKGQSINEASADAAGAAAVASAKALSGDRNKWKIPIAKAMVKRSILACA